MSLISSKLIMLLLYTLLLTLFNISTAKYSNKVLLVGFDGVRWDYLSITDTPNFDRVIQQGSSLDFIDGVFPSATFPSEYSIVTGLYTESHGIVGNKMYDKELNDTFDFASEDPEWWNGGEPVWVTAGQQGLKTGSFFWAGTTVEIRGYRPDFWVPYNESIVFEDRVDQVIEWFVDENIDLGTLYFHEPDKTGHSTGPAPESSDTVAMVQYCDEVLGYLLDQMESAGLSETVNTIIVSDHGMTSCSVPDKVFEIYDYVNPDDIAVIADEITTANILPVSGQTNEVYEALKDQHPNISVYLKEDIPEYYHYRDNSRVHDVVAMADEGWLVVADMSSITSPELNGMHGYDNRLMSMKPMFMALGPNIKQNHRNERFSQIDIYSLMCELLDVQPAMNNGTLEVIGQMLQEN